jgi:signal transduction histidine kinase
MALTQTVVLSVNYAENRRRAKELSERNEFLDQLNRAKTEFLQDMSHEMKAPLTVIATGIDYADRQIKKYGEGLTEVDTTLETIRDETQRLGRMVGGMVELVSMSEPGENRQRVDFSALLKNSAEAFRRALEQRNNKLTLTIAPGLPDVFIEKDRFVQVIANLLSNAAEYTQDGEVSVTADCDGAYITTRIADTGAGIEPELMPRIFERGISGRNGTGYGLYICKTVVEAHGGTIKLECEQGIGTVATFTIPVYGGQEAGHAL